MPKNRFQDLSELPDCNALSIYGKCTRLNVPYCLGDHCSFKRTSQEDHDSRKWANRRLSNLSSSIQNHIANKYYRGTKPWNEISRRRR